MHTFIVLLVWMQFSLPTCTKFAVAAKDQEQAIELAHRDVDTIPDIVASIKLQPTNVSEPTILIDMDLVGEACSFRDMPDGGETDD